MPSSLSLTFYFTNWSAPGRRMTPMLQRLARDLGVDLQIADPDRDPSLIRTCGLRTLPVLIARDGQREICRWTGMRAESDLRSALLSWVSAADR